MDPTANFERLVRLHEPPLDEITGTIAAHRTPQLHVESVCQSLDELSAGFDGNTGSDLLAYLVGEHGFRGNAAEYYDDRNSMIDRVLARRLGIPITLSVVMIEVGRRCGVELVGIGMPGEFLVRERDDATAFHNLFRGVEMDRAGVEDLFVRLHGPSARFSEALVAPTGPLDIAARILANLMQIYLQAGDRDSLIWVLRLRALLPSRVLKFGFVAGLGAVGGLRRGALVAKTC